MAEVPKGLKVYIKPSFSKKGAVYRAIRVLNKKLGGPALTVTTNQKEANVTVRGAKKGSNLARGGGYTERIPKGRGEALSGKTKIQLAAKPTKYSAITPRPKDISVAQIAAHEFQHALGVKHSQMVGGKRKGVKPVSRTGFNFTKASKAKALGVSGLGPKVTGGGATHHKAAPPPKARKVTKRGNVWG